MKCFLTNVVQEHLLHTKPDLGHHFASLGKVCHGLQHPVRIEQGQHII